MEMDVEAEQYLLKIDADEKVQSVSFVEARLNSDEKNLLEISLITPGTSALSPLICAIISSSHLNKDRGMCVLLYSFYGLQMLPALITLKTMMEYWCIDQTPKDFLRFFGRKDSLLMFRIASSAALLLYLIVAYGNPHLARLPTNKPITVAETRSFLVLCAVTVLVDLLSAVKVMLILIMANCEGHRWCSTLFELDPWLTTTGIALNSAHMFITYLVAGMCHHLDLRGVDVEVALLYASVLLWVLRYFKNNSESALSKCILLLCYALYLMRLMVVACMSLWPAVFNV